MNASFNDYKEIIGRLRKFRPLDSDPTQAVACCPAHEDGNPSLALSVAQNDGRLLIRCRSGCPFRAIAQAINAQPKDFFLPGSKPAAGHSWQDYRRYPYYADNSGRIAFEVVEQVNEGGELRRVSRRPLPGNDGRERWQYNIDGAPTALFGMQDVNSNPGRLVWWCSFEEEVEHLAENKLLAVCAPFLPFGDQPRPYPYAGLLRGRHVALPVIGKPTGVELQRFRLLAHALMHGGVESFRVVRLGEGDECITFGDWWSAQADPIPALRAAYDVAAKCGCVTDAERQLREHDLPAENPEQAEIYENAEVMDSTAAEAFSKRLGLLPFDVADAFSLLPAGPRISKTEQCELYPELAPNGNVIGLVRRYEDNRKICTVRSNRGIYIPKTLTNRSGPILIVEGASDTIAASRAGLQVAGRAKNDGSAEQLADLFSGRGMLPAVPDDVQLYVIGENDRKPSKINSSWIWPGRDGAVKVAGELEKMLNRPVKVAMPPDGIKDTRAFLTARTGTWPERGRSYLAMLGIKPPADPFLPAELRDEMQRRLRELEQRGTTARRIEPDKLRELIERAADMIGIPTADPDDRCRAVADCCAAMMLEVCIANRVR